LAQLSDITVVKLFSGELIGQGIGVSIVALVR
jgi:hypothetical protein